MNQPACIETSTMSSLLDRYDVQSLDSARHPHALSLPYRHSAPAKTTGIARDRSATADESPRFVILTCEQVKRLQRQAGVMLSAACLALALAVLIPVGLLLAPWVLLYSYLQKAG